MNFGGQRGNDNMAQVDKEIQELLGCILHHFSNISIKRLHNLAFLIEFKYFEDNERRLTNADYRPYLEGVYSDDVDANLDPLEGVEERKVRISGERVSTLKVNKDFECELDEKGREIVDSIVSNYGEMPRNEIQRTIASTKIYEQVDSGEAIEFPVET